MATQLEFPTLQNKELEARKSVFAIHVFPIAGTLSVKARKIQIHLARAAGLQYMKLSEETRNQLERSARNYIHNFRAGIIPDSPEVLLQPRFSINLKHLAAEIGHPVKEARKLLHFFSQLQSTQVRFNVLNHNAAQDEKFLFPSDIEVVTSLISSYLKSNKMVVSWAYDPVILSIMVNPRTYAQINLALVRNVRTYSALALYENTKRFVSLRKTGALEMKQWQALLSEDGHIPTWEDASEFRRKLRNTLKELEVCGDCDITLEPIETRHEFTNARLLSFRVVQKKQLSIPDLPIPDNKELYEKLLSLGIKEKAVKSLMAEYPEDLIYSKYNMLQRTIKKSPNTNNPAGWLIAAVKRDFVDQESTKATRRYEEELKAAQQAGKEKLYQSYDAFRTEIIRNRYYDLPENEKIQLMEEIKSIMKPAELKLATKVMMERRLFAYLKSKPGWLPEKHQNDFETYQKYLGVGDVQVV